MLGFKKKKPTAIPARDVPGVEGVVWFRPWTIREYEAMTLARAEAFKSTDRSETGAIQFMLDAMAGILLDAGGDPIDKTAALAALQSMDFEAPTIRHLWEFVVKHCWLAAPMETEKNSETTTNAD